MSGCRPRQMGCVPFRKVGIGKTTLTEATAHGGKTDGEASCESDEALVASNCDAAVSSEGSAREQEHTDHGREIGAEFLHD